MPPSEGPVDLTTQTIYAMIPFLDLYAAYKIKKFQWYFVISFGMGLVIGFTLGILLPSPLSVIFSLLLTIGFDVYLIRRWTKEWNAQSFSTL